MLSEIKPAFFLYINEKCKKISLVTRYFHRVTSREIEKRL
jgi:hypothetical protein